MKKNLCKLLVILTSFQLLGGYSLIAALASGVPVPGNNLQDHTAFTHSNNKVSLFYYVAQLACEEEDENEKADPLHFFPDAAVISSLTYHYIPVFSAENKHFLIHYASSIKGKLPAVIVLHNVYRI